MSRTQSEISEWIVAYLSDYLDLPLDQSAVDQRIEEFGLDSAGAVNLAGGLEDWLEIEVDPTLPYDFPTIRELSGKLADIATS